jgi:glycosyltransferase involved in cell wall biosynthesis
LRILLTVHQFFPDYSSGTEVLTLSVAKELCRLGHKVFVFTGYPAKQMLPDQKRFDSYMTNGIEVHRFHHAFTSMGEQHTLSELEYDNHLATGFFAHLLDTIVPDIVHFFHFSRLGASLVDVVRQKGIPAYYTPTDFWSVCVTSQLLLGDGNVCLGPTGHGGNCIKHVAALTHWRSHAKLVKHFPDFVVDRIAVTAKSGIRSQFPFRHDIAALSRRLPFNVSRLNALHGIVSPTNLMTEILTRNGVDKRLIVQSAFGLDISGFDNMQRDFCSGKPLTIGYIGTLAPHKGCHVLIEAFLRIKINGPRLKIYGKLTDFPDYVANLKVLSAGREEIEFLGTFPNDQIANIFAEIDVLVVPSTWYENTPLVVYSALAAKCPVIASNYPGMSEVVRDGWNGLTFEPGNSEALMQCLLRLLRTPKLLIDLSTNCQMPKSIFSYVDELLGLYNDKTRQPYHSAPQRHFIDSFRPSQQYGHVSGWALIDGGAPKAIYLLSEGKKVASTSRFHPRPDVLLGFQDSGQSIVGVNFGFVINVSEHISSMAVLVAEGHHGDIYEIPFKNLSVGKVVNAAKNVVVAIDEFSLAHECFHENLQQA